jgi:hypothetical protein
MNAISDLTRRSGDTHDVASQKEILRQGPETRLMMSRLVMMHPLRTPTARVDVALSPPTPTNCASQQQHIATSYTKHAYQYAPQIGALQSFSRPARYSLRSACAEHSTVILATSPGGTFTATSRVLFVDQFKAGERKPAPRRSTRSHTVLRS